MKALHINRWDIVGGAARAAYGVHNALLGVGVESRMQVQIKASDDWLITGPASTRARNVGRLKGALGRVVTGLQSDPEGGPRKGSWFPSRLAPGLNASDTDVVHLHWIAEETFSPQELPRIDRPLIWTLHDMWPFCGCEHYAPEGDTARWKSGYTRANRNPAARGPDLDRRLFAMKRKAYARQLSIVAPSTWIADCARQSTLLADKPVTVIPHPLDLDQFQPLDQGYARAALGLPAEATIIAFGAVSGKEDPRKGFDLLSDALHMLKERSAHPDILLVIFGQGTPRNPDVGLPYPVKFTGYLRDNLSLGLLYNAADLFVAPARKEAFGLTSAEAAATGCPVVAFDGTGTAEVVDHLCTGYLAQPFNQHDFANGMSWALETNSDGRLGRAARAKAQNEWSYAVVGGAYVEIYEAAIEAYGHARTA